MSLFILFIDLSKAFDFLVRDVVMVWMQNAPTDASERRAHLLKVGFPDGAFDDLMYWLEMNGPSLRQMGVSGDIQQLVCSLHTAAPIRLPLSLEGVRVASSARSCSTSYIQLLLNVCELAFGTLALCLL